MDEILAYLSFGDTGWGDELARGTVVTILLALSSLPFGLVLGFTFALAKNSPRRLWQFIGNIYTTTFRGLPEFLTLLIVYYSAHIVINSVLGFFSAEAEIQVSSFAAGVTALSFVFGAYSSEVILAAIRQIPYGQTEAGIVIGLSRWQIFIVVTFPQLWRHALPGLGNNWMVMLKDTALVSVIGLTELLRSTAIAVGSTKEPFLFYAMACLIYLILSIISGAMISWTERHSQRGVTQI